MLSHRGFLLLFQVAGYMQLVGGELYSKLGLVLLVLYPLCFILRVAKAHAHSSWEKSLAPGS